MKVYQTLNHEQVMTYLPEVQSKIFESAFATGRKDLFFKEKSIDQLFRKPVKSNGRVKIIQKLKNEIYKESW